MSVAETATKNVGVGVVKGSPEFPRHKVQLDLSNGDVSRFNNVPDRRCRFVPEVVLVRRGVFGVLGIWKGKGWGGGGSMGVSLQAT
jgi:hypothetical protein